VHYLREIGPPYPKQQEIIDFVFAAEPNKVKQPDLLCGLAFGKSTVAIDIAVRVLSFDGRQRILFLEPDRNRMENVFLAEWINIVPEELYTLNYGKRIITWKPTGSKLIFWHRDIRGNLATRANMFRGINLTGVIDDEAAEGFLLEQYQNVFNRIRTPSPIRFYLTLTTPQLGAYARWIKRHDHKLFTGTSWDNPYLPDGYIEQMIANMSRDQVRREIYAELIALEGRIWGAFDKDKKWPEGNIYDYDFDPTRPWWLFCDIGSSTGAYTVVQNVVEEARHFGKYGRPVVWVAVADYCPQTNAAVSPAFQRIKHEFGLRRPPEAVVAGGDFGTRDSLMGNTAAYFAQEVFGPVQTISVNESFGSRQVQHDRLSYLMCSALNHRRFCVASSFKELDGNSKRGIMQMVDEDVWPDDTRRRANEFMPKDSKIMVSHIRDALLAGTVAVMAPPEYGYTRELAAS
jgi:hypothetical protein